MTITDDKPHDVDMVPEFEEQSSIVPPHHFITFEELKTEAPIEPMSLKKQSDSSLLRDLLENEADCGNDEAVAAATLYKAWKSEVEELFYQASHGKRLLNLNGAEDIAYCAKIDVVRVLPKQSSAGLLVAA